MTVRARLWLFINRQRAPVGEGALWESSTLKSDSKGCATLKPWRVNSRTQAAHSVNVQPECLDCSWTASACTDKECRPLLKFKHTEKLRVA